ncbi:MAG: chromosome segregation SMC family protein [Candidatus Moraniibacteriota bacterium]|jgi:chromosome segregation protein
MYLKRIEIKGFKSFAAETSFDFLPKCNSDVEKGCGITAIVGPNGSGKSNISDAVRWVMGEQSMKNLRGKKSEDVIFSGSEKKGKLSMASVALVFDNTDKTMPVEFDEVIITRKIYRNGESEYLINDARVRLLDIVDILARTGIGKESHCVVGQGMTDAILNATPIERRGIIEDAAGVKHFQIRKNRAIKKLDKTKDNLDQVQTLITEVTPHLRSLRRQANKAKQGKEVFEQLKEKQRQYFGAKWSNLFEEKTNLENQRQDVGITLKNAEREVDKLSDQILEESKKVEDAEKIGVYEKEKREVYVKLQSLEKKIAVAEGHIEIQKERKNHEEKVKSIPVDLVYVQKQLDGIRNEQSGLVDSLEKVEDLSEVKEIVKKLKKIHREIDRLYVDAGKKQIEVVQDDYADKVKKYDDKIAELDEQISEHAQKVVKVKEKIKILEEKITSAVAADKQARTQFFALEKDLREKQRLLDAIREQFNEIKVNIARTEVREEDVVSEVRQELGIEVQDLKVADGAEELEMTFEEMEQAVYKLRSKYEQIGGIDPMVIDEYEEMQERFDLMANESEDLTEAIKQLKEVIKEMDEKIHKAFVSAFKEINEEFTKYFRILFNGGNAKLKKVNIDVTPRKKKEDEIQGDVDIEVLQDEEDDEEEEVKKVSTKTEVGIEIVASPPGKKVKHLSLLSGGERSLTSVAVLLAIISYNPPPFIILDEVEAALDEANSRRLAKIFAELSHRTQFIIITHNRETMRHADILYGVTMGNDGATQLLSVKLDQIKNDGKIETESNIDKK